MDAVGATLLGAVGGWSAGLRPAGIAAWLVPLALTMCHVPTLSVPLVAGLLTGAAAHGAVHGMLARRVA